MSHATVDKILPVHPGLISLYTKAMNNLYAYVGAATQWTGIRQDSRKLVIKGFNGGNGHTGYDAIFAAGAECIVNLFLDINYYGTTVSNQLGFRFIWHDHRFLGEDCVASCERSAKNRQGIG